MAIIGVVASFVVIAVLALVLTSTGGDDEDTRADRAERRRQASTSAPEREFPDDGSGAPTTTSARTPGSTVPKVDVDPPVEPIRASMAVSEVVTAGPAEGDLFVGSAIPGTSGTAERYRIVRLHPSGTTLRPVWSVGEYDSVPQEIDVAGDTVYVRFDAQVLALDLKGEQRWLSAPNLVTPCDDCGLPVGDGYLVAGAGRGVYWDRGDAVPRWEQSGPPDSAAAVVDGKIVWFSTFVLPAVELGRSDPGQAVLEVVDPIAEVTRRRVTFPCSAAPDDRPPSDRALVEPLPGTNDVVVLWQVGYVCAARVDLDAGRVTWEQTLSGPFPSWGAEAVVDERGIFVGLAAGVAAIDPETGKPMDIDPITLSNEWGPRHPRGFLASGKFALQSDEVVEPGDRDNPEIVRKGQVISAEIFDIDSSSFHSDLSYVGDRVHALRKAGPSLCAAEKVVEAAGCVVAVDGQEWIVVYDPRTRELSTEADSPEFLESGPAVVRGRVEIGSRADAPTITVEQPQAHSVRVIVGDHLFLIPLDAKAKGKTGEPAAVWDG